MTERTRVPLHRDPKFRALIIQVLALGLVVYGFYSLFQTTVDNLVARGIQTGTSFFDEVAPFQIGFSPFFDYKLGESTYIDVFFVGIQNTILVAVLGIVAATILGFFIGVIRLSPNWLISRGALAYIEIFRNVPLLLQIMFWNFAIFLPSLPAPKNSIELGAFYLNARGFHTPLPVIENSTGFGIWIALLAILCLGLVVFAKRAKARFEETGQQLPVGLISLATIVGGGYILYLISGSPLIFDEPVLGRFNFKGGGQLPLPLFSLWFALTLYTAAFIAENVRAGIQSVSHGQNEAAHALGLSRKDTVRLVTIPQALRVIIPPTISQYLNLTKNSSLAVAVGYEELVAVWAGITLNQTGQALVIIGMTVAVYECLSLFTSFVLNWYNKRIQLTER
ncbi:MAG: ABC transporter permease subunit [Gammaproteobacteria bacterium]|nr:ABC transporter permease subunit [Gammaproteobacteria bacterium]